MHFVSGPHRFENVFETGILPDLSQWKVIINQLPPQWPGPVYLLARYFSDAILPCSLTPLMRFGLLNCPAVWLSTLGLRAHLLFPSGFNVRIVDSVELTLNDGLWLTSQ